MKLLENIKKKKIAKVAKQIGENVKTLKDTEDISGIEEAAKSIIKNQKQETIKRRFLKAIAFFVVILIASLIFKFCPSCATFLIKYAPEIISVIFGV